MRTRWTTGFGACALAELVALGSIDIMADRIAIDEPRLVRTQGIADRRIGTLMPAALSHDGRLIAFVSQHRRGSARLCFQDVYTLDRSTGLTTLESVSLDGSCANGDSQGPSLSSDGRILAFQTFASNLVSGDLPVGSGRVVVRDRRYGVLRTPKNSLQETPNGESGQPIVAAGGMAVAFTSAATNLVAGSDTNGTQTDIYLWRLEDSTITRVSVDNNGVQPSIGASYSPSLSRDGELVAFVSTARLTAEDTNDVSDVYIRDLRRGVTSLVSAGIASTPSDAPSYWPQLSADGRYVAFVSKRANLAPRDRNQESDVYLSEVATRSIALVSATSKGEAANASSSRPAISADGRVVVFQSVASNLGPRPGCPPRVPDKNLLPDVYLFDSTTGCVTRISGSPTREWWTPSVAPAISGSGAVVTFSSTQPISEDDVTTDLDLFLYIRPNSQPRLPAPLTNLSPPAGVCAILVPTGAMDASENPVLSVVRNVARLAALTHTGLLDSPPEEAFDRFTRLASHVLRARTALLSLVDEDRQFFKSAQGLSEPWATKRETPITYSICKHVVANASGVVLPDAKMDRVVGGCPGIDALRLVAYAGMPIRSIDGHVLGALCVMDDKRREWTTGELEALRDLADCVTEEIVLRTQIHQLLHK